MNDSFRVSVVGTTVAVFVAAVLTAGILAVPYRSLLPPEDSRQERLHLNTKNTTRFMGKDPGEIAAAVSRAVYPAVSPESTPDLVILYAVEDWQGGLAASSLLRPLNAVLLPAAGNVQKEIDRLKPGGSVSLGGKKILAMNKAPAKKDALRVVPGDILSLLEKANAPPLHAILVDEKDPASALLAAPWAAFSGDLIVFDSKQAPPEIPLYALGDVRVNGLKPIRGKTPVRTSIIFAEFFNPDDLFGWNFNKSTLTGYRAFILASPNDPAAALLSANLAWRGKPGPLLWADGNRLPPEIKNYLWGQRPAFWTTPSEGPFHHFWILGDEGAITFAAQSQADYAVEIGPYRMKGPGMSGMDVLASIWIALGFASSLWIVFHAARFLPWLNWVMKLAWPLLAMAMGPFGILFYWLAYRGPVIDHNGMVVWDRPLWLQGMAATAGSVGIGAQIMVATGFLISISGLPMVSGRGPLFWLGSPMVLVMVANFVVAVIVAWLLYQTPMLSMFHGQSYKQALPGALPIVLVSMAAASLAMFPAMWWLMMWNLPMMPQEENILWFGVMFFSVFLAFLVAWPFNCLLVLSRRKSGLM